MGFGMGERAIITIGRVWGCERRYSNVTMAVYMSPSPVTPGTSELDSKGIAGKLSLSIDLWRYKGETATCSGHCKSGHSRAHDGAESCGAKPDDFTRTAFHRRTGVSVRECFVIGWAERGVVVAESGSNTMKAIDTGKGSGNRGREWKEDGREIAQQRVFDRQVGLNAKTVVYPGSNSAALCKSRFPRWHLYSGKSRAVDSTTGTMDR